jgi:hypothetical protein
MNTYKGLLRQCGAFVPLADWFAELLIWLLEMGVLCVCKWRNQCTLFGALVPPDWLSKFEGDFLR